MVQTEEKKFDKIKYNNDFISQNYDRINLTVPKGKKAVIQEYAKSKGESLNSFINKAIDKAISTKD